MATPERAWKGSRVPDRTGSLHLPPIEGSGGCGAGLQMGPDLNYLVIVLVVPPHIPVSKPSSLSVLCPKSPSDRTTSPISMVIPQAGPPSSPT